MVEPEEPLEKILSDHKEWIVSEGNKGRQADLTERKLRWPHLRGADLTGVNCDRSGHPKVPKGRSQLRGGQFATDLSLKS